jgi:hypothetical protein
MAGDNGHTLIAQDYGDIVLPRQNESFFRVIRGIDFIIVFKEILQ